MFNKELNDPLQTCFKISVKHSTLCNNLCMIWFFHQKLFFLTYKIDLAHFCSNSYDKVHKMSLFLEGSVDVHW